MTPEEVAAADRMVAHVTRARQELVAAAAEAESAGFECTTEELATLRRTLDTIVRSTLNGLETQ